MTTETTTALWPTEIRLSSDRRILTVTYDNQEVLALTAEKLRVESPSAEVQGHHPSEKKHITGKQDVLIQSIVPMGNYAVRLAFDDGHDTGIYTWDYLYQLGR